MYSSHRIGLLLSPMQASRNSRLPGSFNPAFVRGVAAAHHNTSPRPYGYFTTTISSLFPYSAYAAPYDAHSAWGAIVISGAARVIADGPIAETFFQLIPSDASGTASFSGRKVPENIPVAIMRPPSARKLLSASRSSRVGASKGSANTTVAFFGRST